MPRSQSEAYQPPPPMPCKFPRSRLVWFKTNTRIRTVQNQQTSPLLRLPAELRNQIFGLAFGCFLVPVGKYKYSSKLFCAQVPKNTASATLIELLEATACCRQVHAETALLPFKNNDISLGGMDQACVRTFVTALTPAQKEAVTSVHLTMDGWGQKQERSLSYVLELSNLRRLKTTIFTMHDEQREAEGYMKMIEGAFEKGNGPKPELVFEVFFV